MPRGRSVLSFGWFRVEIQTGAQPLLGVAPSNTQNQSSREDQTMMSVSLRRFAFSAGATLLLVAMSAPGMAQASSISQARVEGSCIETIMRLLTASVTALLLQRTDFLA